MQTYYKTEQNVVFVLTHQSESLKIQNQNGTKLSRTRTIISYMPKQNVILVLINQPKKLVFSIFTLGDIYTVKVILNSNIRTNGKKL